MADKNGQGDAAARKSQARLATTYARRARKALQDEADPESAVRGQAYSSLASTHAMLDLAEAIRSNKPSG